MMDLATEILEDATCPTRAMNLTAAAAANLRYLYCDE